MKSRIKIVWVLCGLATLLVLVERVVTSRATFVARNAGRVTAIRRMWVDLFDYRRAQSAFPTLVNYGLDGKPASSWRLSVYSHAHSTKRPVDLTVSWDSPVNSKVIEAGKAVYGEGSSPGMTVGIYAFLEDGGIFEHNSSTIPNECAILLSVEVPQTHVWSAPGDAAIDGNSLVLGSERLTMDGSLEGLVMFADGEVWKITGPQGLKWAFAFANMEYAKTHSREKSKPVGCVKRFSPKQAH